MEYFFLAFVCNNVENLEIMKMDGNSSMSADSRLLESLRQRMIDAVEAETYVWTGVFPGAETHPLSNRIHASVLQALSGVEIRGADARSQSVDYIRMVVRERLIREINLQSIGLLRSARDTYAILSVTPVQYLINVSNDRSKPEWDSFDFEAFPFINGHAESLDAALRLRNAGNLQQLKAIKFLKCRADMSSLEISKAMAADEGPNEAWDAILRANEQSTKYDLALLTKQLDDQTREAALDFYSSIVHGTPYPYAIPIEIGLRSKQDDLRTIGLAFREFGGAIRIPFHLKLKGQQRHKALVREACIQYDEIGHAFRFLAAWIAALEVTRDATHCEFCYRHASTAKRCTFHLTFKKELKAGRLARRIHPGYVKCLRVAVTRPEVRFVLRSTILWDDAAPTPEFATELDAVGLNYRYSKRATVLANQLRQLFPLLNDSMSENFARLFKRVLLKVSEIQKLPEPVGDARRDAREHLHQLADEMLSLKGFFKAWCGKGAYAREIQLNMLEFDSANPILRDAPLDSYLLRHMLLAQCTWEDEQERFLSRNMPTYEQIRKEVDEFGPKIAASRLGLGVSTVYKWLSRKEERKRNHFR